MKRIIILLVTTFSLLGFSQDIKLNGTVSVQNNQIKNVLEPTDGNDVVTKDYLISENNKLKQEIDSLKLKFNDLDGDGIIGDSDLCPFTISGRPVDENGCQNPIYLDDNGVTVKSHDWGRVGDNGKLNGIKYVIVDREMLKSMIINNEDLSKICTSKITDLGDECDSNDMYNYSPYCGFFNNINPNQDISSWDVSNVVNMKGMFRRSEFNGDISNWDVSSVVNMKFMFGESSFTGDISNWDVGNVTIMTNLFKSSDFNGDISSWDVSSVTDMVSMFSSSQFNGDISSWDVSSVTDMSFMFSRSQFNGDISNWDVSSVTDMGGMFLGNSFNSIINPFNGDISNWDVSNVTDLSSMFSSSQFNGDISNWDVSNVTKVRSMFSDNEVFNQDLSSWDVSNVTDCFNFYRNTPQWTLPKPNFTNCSP